jgi:hypothetical protein
MSKKELVIQKAIDILAEQPEGLRWSDLLRQVLALFPEFPHGTVSGSLWDMDQTQPSMVFKPARGLWKHTKYKDISVTTPSITQPDPQLKPKIKEEDFYQSFADWLKNDLEDCTKAIPLGGNRFGGKWSTPDVIGIREASRSDIIKGTTEIVSAEIKLNESSLIEAFGQACSYKVFSHKCYLVVPDSSSEDDIARLDSLCMIFGIGLVLYDSSNVAEPTYLIKTRPQKHEPDMFYVNRNLKIIEKELFEN